MQNLYGLLFVFIAGLSIFTRGWGLKVFVFATGLPVLSLYAITNDYELSGIILLNARGLAYADEGLWIAILALLITFCVLGLSKPMKALPVLNITAGSRFFLFFFFLLSVILAYPGAMLGTADRFGLIPGVAWGVFLVIFGTFFCISSFGKNKDLFSYAFIFLCLFIIVSGERVEILLLLILHVYYVSKGTFLRFNILSAKFYLSVSLLFSLIFYSAYVGYSRIGEDFHLEFVILLLYKFSTLLDVTHVFLSGLDYVGALGTQPSVMLSTLMTFLPTALIDKCNFDYTCFLDNYVPNAGGGLYFQIGQKLVFQHPDVVFLE